MSQLFVRHGFLFGFPTREAAEARRVELQAKGHHAEVCRVYYPDGPVWLTIDHTARQDRQGRSATPKAKVG
jgi:hypothetical protein